MKAILKNYRQSPRKVRLVADVLRGDSVDTALTKLQFLDKRAALPIQKLIQSAVANAEQDGYERSALHISSVRVDEGVVLKRFMPRARGAASRINKRNSHITVELRSTKVPKTKTSQEAVAA